jgi:hypothetical protein
MSKKPYMYEHLEWLEIFSRKDWNDPTVNPDDLAEYSEFGKPYAQPDGEDTYQGWEFTWPGLPIYPDLPPIIKPDPVESACNLGDSCLAIGIIGGDTLECGDCYTYTHLHVILSCEPQWWMAFGSWTFDPGSTHCYLLFSGPIMATVCCEEVSPPGVAILSYEGPLECSDTKQIIVGCEECCEQMELTGLDTVAAGNPWTGTINPACPCAECEVISNSGCSLGCTMNEAGSQVTVTPGGGDCGSFTVTVTDKCVGDECDANQVVKTVRITGGGAQWSFVSSADNHCNDSGQCGCGYGFATPYAACIFGGFKYGTNNGATFDCSQAFGYSCVAGADCGAGDAYPPCGGGAQCGDPGGACGGGPQWCTSKVWHKCEWKCSC